MATNFQIQKNRTSETLLELVNRNFNILHNRQMKDSVGKDIAQINNVYDIHTGTEIDEESARSSAIAIYEDGGFMAMLGFIEDLNQKNKNLLINIYKSSSFSNATTKPAGNLPRTNKYDPIVSANHTYDQMFRDVNGFPGDAPSNADIEEHARVGYNLGQQLGRQFGKPFANADSIWENLNTMIKDIATGHSDFTDFLTFIEDPINSQRLEGHFSPNFNRPQIPELEKISLESLLNQNLLLPTGSIGKPFVNISTGVDVFKDSYLNNRGKTKHVGDEGEPDSEFPEGIIGGVPVHDLQEPQNPRGSKPTENKLFDFKDDAIYLTEDSQDRGFDSNIKTNVKDVASGGRKPVATLEPAVINMTPKKGDPSAMAAESVMDATAAESIGLSDQQFFPFMFETENKRGVKQYAFFQAALMQLQESYSPSWQSKTFVGRTDKIHTYTDTDRVLDLSFAIFALTGRALQNLRERVTWLAQQTYGEHEVEGNAVTRIKAGPLLRLTIGDMFSRVPGYLRNLSLDWNYLGPGGKWELTRGLRMPQGVSVACSFQVIHQVLPDRDLDFYWGLEAGMPATGNKPLIPLIGDLATEGERSSGLQESYLQRLHLKG